MNCLVTWLIGPLSIVTANFISVISSLSYPWAGLLLMSFLALAVSARATSLKSSSLLSLALSHSFCWITICILQILSDLLCFVSECLHLDIGHVSGFCYHFSIYYESSGGPLGSHPNCSLVVLYIVFMYPFFSLSAYIFLNNLFLSCLLSFVHIFLIIL